MKENKSLGIWKEQFSANHASFYFKKPFHFYSKAFDFDEKLIPELRHCLVQIASMYAKLVYPQKSNTRHLLPPPRLACVTNEIHRVMSSCNKTLRFVYQTTETTEKTTHPLLKQDMH
jgi:hypothetical protein